MIAAVGSILVVFYKIPMLPEEENNQTDACWFSKTLRDLHLAPQSHGAFGIGSYMARAGVTGE